MMLTNTDRRVFEETGNITPERLKALQHALRSRAKEARESARAEGVDERFAASLRGKAHAYDECADMVNAIKAGKKLKKPRRVRVAQHLSRNKVD